MECGRLACRPAVRAAPIAAATVWRRFCRETIRMTATAGRQASHLWCRLRIRGCASGTGGVLPAMTLDRCKSAPTTEPHGRRCRHSMEKTAVARIMTAAAIGGGPGWTRSEEHTSELQSLRHLVCRLL